MCKAGHKTCEGCHDSWSSAKDEVAPCPLCRGPMIEDNWDKIMHREVRNLVTEPQVGNQCECPWMTCGYISTFADLLAHVFDHPRHTCSDGLIELFYKNSRIMVRGVLCTVRTQLPVAANANAADVVELRYTGDIASGARGGLGLLEEGYFDLASGGMRYNHVYKGEWVRNQRNGEGSAFGSSGGIEYKGGWKDDKKHGQGKSYYPLGNNSECRLDFVGRWQHGEPAEGTWYDETGCVVHEGKRDGSETA